MSTPSMTKVSISHKSATKTWSFQWTFWLTDEDIIFFFLLSFSFLISSGNQTPGRAPYSLEPRGHTLCCHRTIVRGKDDCVFKRVLKRSMCCPPCGIDFYPVITSMFYRDCHISTSNWEELAHISQLTS